MISKSKSVNYPTVYGMASCFMEEACPSITALAVMRSRGFPILGHLVSTQSLYT